jgi:monoamine oxidase
MSSTAEESTGGRCYTMIKPLDMNSYINRGQDKLSHTCKDHAMCTFHVAPISVHANDLIDKYEFLVKPSVVFLVI